jgi:hypothetical protein
LRELKALAYISRVRSVSYELGSHFLEHKQHILTNGVDVHDFG